MKEFKKLLDCLNRQVSELELSCKAKDAKIAELEKKLTEVNKKGIKDKWDKPQEDQAETAHAKASKSQ
jgi:hypothetical protein